jgi:hypothetical protein
MFAFMKRGKAIKKAVLLLFCLTRRSEAAA